MICNSSRNEKEFQRDKFVSSIDKVSSIITDFFFRRPPLHISQSPTQKRLPQFEKRQVIKKLI